MAVDTTIKLAELLDIFDTLDIDISYKECTHCIDGYWQDGGLCAHCDGSQRIWYKTKMYETEQVARVG